MTQYSGKNKKTSNLILEIAAKALDKKTSRIQIGESKIDVPSIEHVDILESNIKDLNKRLSLQESVIKKLTSSLAKTLEEINRLKIELDNKLNAL